MQHYYRKPLHVAPRPNRRDIARRCALTLLLAALPAFAHAISTLPVINAPAPSGPGAVAELDLMEEAFREGVRLYQSGDYTGAVRVWQTPAKRGHAGAQFSLGVAYVTGNGVAQSLEHAIQWWHAAAAQGHVSAQLNLGLLYWRGEGVEKDIAKARLWWRQAAEGGDAMAQFHLGALAATGEGEPLNYQEAVRWWRRAAAQGHHQAIKGLEILKSSGVRVDAY